MLKPKLNSYSCAHKSLYIDHDELEKILKAILEDEKSETIIVLTFINMFVLTVQMLAHCAMMVRWYRENPQAERRAKRSIKVGLPVNHTPNAQRVDEGHAVPEADRQERPISIKLRERVTGIPLKDNEDDVHIETPLATASNAISSFSSKIHGRTAVTAVTALPLPTKHYGQPAMVLDLGDPAL